MKSPNPVEARQDTLELVAMLADELVHARIARDLRREYTPPSARLVRVVDPARNPILPPREDFVEVRGISSSLIAALLGSAASVLGRPPISVRAFGQQRNELPSRLRGDTAPPRCLAWLRPSGRGRQL